MKKSIGYIVVLFFFVSLFQGCEDMDDKLNFSSDAKEFVWRGLNQYYLWQEEVPDLADERFSGQQFGSFLAGFQNPTDLFNHLLYEKGVTDRFSVIFSDYTVLEQLLSGSSKNNGVDYGLFLKASGSNEVIGWVRYILPDSDASNKPIERGDLFYAINGTPLTTENYQSLLENETYTLNLADYDNGNFTPNGEEVSLTKTAYSENPVYYRNVYTVGSHKIGYLVYNGFYGDYDSQLNGAFAYFQGLGVTDLILDLRYNSGGLVSSATRLASMITGQFTGDIFAKQEWNSKIMPLLSEETTTNRFTTTLSGGGAINSLNFNKLYVITSRSTASASELVINGLEPYIDIIQVGTVTTGKNVGSITLYDSPNFRKENLNPNHRYAMQPITFRVVNSVGFGDYHTGLAPDVELAENMGNLLPLGDENELLLNATINHILGTETRPLADDFIRYEHFTDTKAMTPLRAEMYN
ncbi:MAG: S41 family peptidase [Flavobacteriaceae bacterium]